MTEDERQVLAATVQEAELVQRLDSARVQELARVDSPTRQRTAGWCVTHFLSPEAGAHQPGLSRQGTLVTATAGGFLL